MDMKAVPAIVALLITLTSTAISQWTNPRAIDSTQSYYYLYAPGNPLAVATGKPGELALAVSRNDSLICMYSKNCGKDFSRSVISYRSGDGWYTGYPGPVDGIGFDSHSNIFVFWRSFLTDGGVTWEGYIVSKSADHGKTFTTFWRGDGSILLCQDLVKPAFYVDSRDQLHCIWLATTMNWSRELRYSRFSASDSSAGLETVLPSFSCGVWNASADLLPVGDTVRIALSARGTDDGQLWLYYLQSTDGGATFPAMTTVDTSVARYPQFVLTNANLRVMYAIAPSNNPESTNDTALVARAWSDTSLNSRQLVLDHLGADWDPIEIRSRDSSISLVFTHAYPDCAVSWYELNSVTLTLRDSLLLPGHFKGQIALDTLGGKYLVSVFQNRLLISTKDVILTAPDDPKPVPEVFSLSQNYPNPFNPATTIRYQLASSAQVRLAVFDVLGREVAVLVNERQTAGSYSTSFDAAKLSSGVYFFRMQAGGFNQTRKIVLLR